ncbi:MAG: helix-turn-helix transcriptional regulator [Lachnospiraceae bacterium]|nr:helix-turn-helix transcriptional regulator [Lachnospiraceae bacterium]
MTVGERVKQLRNFEKLTLEKFGYKLGVGKTAISKIEHGENSVTDQMIKSICREFNVREEWLRDGTGPMKPVIDEDVEYGQICANLGISDKRAKQIIMNYGKFSPEDKELFWNFINKLVESENNNQQDQP